MALCLKRRFYAKPAFIPEGKILRHSFRCVQNGKISVTLGILAYTSPKIGIIMIY